MLVESVKRPTGKDCENGDPPLVVIGLDKRVGNYKIYPKYTESTCLDTATFATHFKDLPNLFIPPR